MKRIALVLFLILVTLVGCQQPPVAEIAAAEAAIASARDAEAPKYAAETFAAAEQKLADARTNVESKEYAVAMAQAIGARELADAAAREARKRKAEEDALRKQEEANRAARGEFAPEIQQTLTTESLTGVGMESSQVTPVYFAFDQYSILPEQRPVLDAAIAWLTKNATIRVRLEGHTDERGEAEYNLALGRRRALAVKDDLIAAGIAADRIDTVTLGEEDPADRGHTEDAWAKNRRVGFMLLRPNEAAAATN